MGEIRREDMLELTRRMTLKRNCSDRIAGAYFDEEGYVDGEKNKKTEFKQTFLALPEEEMFKYFEILRCHHHHHGRQR